MRTFMACFVLLALAAPAAHAGLLDRLFKGKTEEQVAREFEAGIAPFLDAICKDKTKARPVAYIEIKRQVIYCQLESIKGDVCTFARLVKYDWHPHVGMYGHFAHEPKYTVKVGEIPPLDIARMYDVSAHPPEKIVSLVFWLAQRKQLWQANAKLCAFLFAKPEFKDDGENWLCEKFGWTRPEKGLTYMGTFDFETLANGHMAVTPEGETARLAELDKVAAAVAKRIEEQRGDAKGAIGTRRKPPAERLETLKHQIARFEKSFANTPYVLNKKNMEKLAALATSIDEDLAEIKNRMFAAERDGIDDKWMDAARKYEQTLSGDPKNHDILYKTADAWYRAAVVTDGGKSCKHPDAMKKSAERFEELVAEFPLMLNYRNFAGAAWRAASDARKAKAHFEYVLRNAPEGDDNRTFARNQLAAMK